MLDESVMCIKEDRPSTEHGHQNHSLTQSNKSFQHSNLAIMLKVAAEISTNINTAAELDAVFEDFIQKIIKNYGLYQVMVFMFNQDTATLSLHAGHGAQCEKMIEEKYSIQLHHPHSLIAEAARTKKVVIANDIDNFEHYLSCPSLPETQSEAAMPMITGGQLIGVLDMQHTHVDYFTEEKVNIFLNLCSQIAGAFQNVRYVNQIKQNLDEAQYQVTLRKRFASIKTTDEILDAIIEEAYACLPVSTYLLIPDSLGSEQYYVADRVVVSSEMVDSRYIVKGRKIPAEVKLLFQLLNSESTYVSTDIVIDNIIDPGVRLRLDKANIRSFMISSFAYQENTIGYLLRLSSKPFDFANHKTFYTEMLLSLGSEALETVYIEEEQNLMQFSVAQAPLAILWIRPDGTLYSINDTACLLLGYSRQELLAISSISILDPNMIPSVWHTHWCRVQKDHRFTIKTEYRTKLGKLIPVEVTTNYLKYGDQEYNCVFVRDITKRQQIEHTRDQFTIQLHTSAEIAKQVGAILDPDELLNTVIPLLKEQFQLYHAHVYVLEDKLLLLKAGYGQPGQIMVQQGHKIPFHHPRSLVAKAARTREAVLVNDVSKAIDHMPNILLPKTQSEVAVPIIFRGKVLGVFDVQSDRLNNFSELDLDAFRILAGQFANAMYSATVFENQKNTSDELKKTAATIRGIFNAMSEGILLMDMMGNIIDLNDAALQLFEYADSDDLINRNVAELVTRPSLTRLAESLRRAIDIETDLEISEYAMITRQGDVFDAELCFSLLKDLDGIPTGIVCITRNITERKRMHRELARFQALAENAVDAIVMADLSGHIDYANRACYNLYGYDYAAEDMTGTLLFSMWQESAMTLLIEEVLPSAGSNGWQGEVLQVRRDKSTFDASLTCFSVKSETGQPLCIAAIIRDITERKKAENELQRFAIQLSTAAKVSTQVNTILEPAQLLEEVVPLVQTRFDLYHVHVYTFDDMGENLVMRVGSGEPGFLMRERGHSIPCSHQHSLVAKAARTQEIVLSHDVTSEVDFLPNALLPNTRTELAIPMIVTGQVVGVFDVQDDKPNRFSTSEVDVLSTLAAQTATSFRNARSFAEIQNAAERLREVDRLKSEFLSNMSHELRTPLNSILGYAEVMLMGIDGELPDMMKEDVEAIYDNGQQLLALINDILDLTKIEAGQMTLNFQPVELVPLLEGSKTNNMGLLLKRKVPVEIHINVEHEIPPIYADRIRILQILNNLVSNAVKFTDEGKITISARYLCSKESVEIEVKDTGVGIPAEDIPQLFGRFKQVDGSSTRKAEGTGLGLAITKHLVELHDGELRVDSSFNEGSTFTVSIPVYKEE